MTSGDPSSGQIAGCRILAGVVTFNRADILPKALASLRSQKGIALSVAVIDDGSTDGTRALRSQFPEAEWTLQPTTAGHVVGRNDLMARAGYDYFVSLDDDAWFLNGDEIATAVRYLEENPLVGAVAFDILSPDRPRQVPRSAPEQVATFIGCGHILRLSAIREVGGYEPAPGLYGGEEKDLCLRLLDAGYAVMKLPGVHVWHDKTLVARQITDQHRSGVCNDLVMTFRRTPGLILPVALTAKLYRHSRFSLPKGLMAPCLAGFRLFFRSLPALSRSRRPVKPGTLRQFIRLARS